MNREKKESKALSILYDEVKFNDRSASKLLDRLREIDLSRSNLEQAIKLDPGDFVKREFLRQLEKEKGLLITHVLKKGWPKSYLKKLFANQKLQQ